MHPAGNGVKPKGAGGLLSGLAATGPPPGGSKDRAGGILDPAALAGGMAEPPAGDDFGFVPDPSAQARSAADDLRSAFES